MQWGETAVNIIHKHELKQDLLQEKRARHATWRETDGKVWFREEKWVMYAIIVWKVIWILFFQIFAGLISTKRSLNTEERHDLRSHNRKGKFTWILTAAAWSSSSPPSAGRNEKANQWFELRKRRKSVVTFMLSIIEFIVCFGRLGMILTTCWTDFFTGFVTAKWCLNTRCCFLPIRITHIVGLMIETWLLMMLFVSEIGIPWNLRMSFEIFAQLRRFPFKTRSIGIVVFTWNTQIRSVVDFPR